MSEGKLSVKQTIRRRWKFDFELDTETIAQMQRLIGHIVDEEGGSAEVEGEVEVAVGEILRNAYRHAYHGRPGPLEVEVSVDEAEWKSRFTITARYSRRCR